MKLFHLLEKSDMKILEGQDQELYHCLKKRHENSVEPRKYFNYLCL